MNLTAAIVVNNLTKKYPLPRSYIDLVLHPFQKNFFNALQNINLQVATGELFCLLGTNGAGKTTLIKILCSLVLPTSGRVLVAGEDVALNHRAVRQKIGYVVSDERSFYWRLTGRQNLEFFARLHRIPSHQIQEKLNYLFAWLDLADTADRPFKNYSSGMKQKLAIARGLLNDPAVVFMDEPTRSLDPLAANALRRFIKERIVNEKEKTVFLATHQLHEAEALGDKIGILHRGKLLACDSIDKIIKNKIRKTRFRLCLAQPSQTLITQMCQLPAIPLPALPATDSPKNGRLQEFEITAEETDISGCIRQIVDWGGAIVGCIRQKPALEDVFAAYLEEKEND